MHLQKIGTQNMNNLLTLDMLKYIFDRDIVLNDLINKYDFNNSQAQTWIFYNFETLKNEIVLNNRCESANDEFKLYSFYEDELEFLILSCPMVGQKG